MDTATQELGDLLHQWREEAELPLEHVATFVSHMLPRGPHGRPTRVSRELVRRYESGLVDYRSMDPWTLGCITLALGHKVSELPEYVREDISDRLSWLRDLGKRMSAWTTESAARGA